MCLYLEIKYLENKNGRGWVQLGKGVRVRLTCGYKTLGDDSKTTLGMPF